MITISKEALRILEEVIDNESVQDYWKSRFDNLDIREEEILRGCFKELTDSNLIYVRWADDYPYHIQVLKDGYLYKTRKEEKEDKDMSQFEKELLDLLERTKTINKPVNASYFNVNTTEYNRPSTEWMNDVQIFYAKYLKEHPLGDRINSLLSRRGLDDYSELVACLRSISRDKAFLDKMKGESAEKMPSYNMRMYDVFLSHANKDKPDIVEELYGSLNKLGISIFYDKESLEWGDKWKDRILEGTQKAEFAIIVISENFFDREWTERELAEFLERQNQNGQKLILPIVHNISNEDLQKKYPLVADIQAIDSQNYSCDEIALLFAGQLIKRLKGNSC